MLRTIGIAKEGICAEDPHGADKQVAIFPQEARALIEEGCRVSIEQGAGERMGFPDQSYAEYGVRVESAEELYSGKDLVVKIKGPAEDNLSRMDPGSTLFCMAHLPMYPERRRILENRRVTVVAMEAVAEQTAYPTREQLAPKLFAKEVFDKELRSRPANERHVVVVGYSFATDGMIRYFGRKQLGSLLVVPAIAADQSLPHIPAGAVVVCDSVTIPAGQSVLLAARRQGHSVHDFAHYTDSDPDGEIPKDDFFANGEPPRFGRRSIQCLHETGRAGALYGLKLLNSDPVGRWSGSDEAFVLGYGNVAMGAINQCVQKGQPVYVLGRYNTHPSRIEPLLQRAKLVVNGAFIPDDRAGIDFVVTNRHVDEVMRPGTVLIDLIGGSPTDRSPVEPVETCTFLGDPMFERNGVRIASVFAWPNYFRTDQTNRRYSNQILNVLTREGGLLQGFQNLDPGIQRAVVLGPFDSSELSSAKS